MYWNDTYAHIICFGNIILGIFTIVYIELKIRNR